MWSSLESPGANVESSRSELSTECVSSANSVRAPCSAIMRVESDASRRCSAVVHSRMSSTLWRAVESTESSGRPAVVRSSVSEDGERERWTDWSDRGPSECRGVATPRHRANDTRAKRGGGCAQRYEMRAPLWRGRRDARLKTASSFACLPSIVCRLVRASDVASNVALAWKPLIPARRTRTNAMAMTSPF